MLAMLVNFLLLLLFSLNAEKFIILESLYSYRTIKSYENTIHHLNVALLYLI